MDFHWATLFSSQEAIFWKVIVPPVLYFAHGYLATWMAIVLLFRPYEAHYFPFTKIQLPLTPGIFPKRRGKLAQAVASTVTDTLLTPADIKNQVEHLLTEDNIRITIGMLFDSILKEFRDTTKLHRLASDIAELSPTLLEHFVSSSIESLEAGRDTKVAAITEKVFDQVILTTRISLEQANEFAARILEAFATPPKVRQALITLLSPGNISSLDESIGAHASGPYKLLARIIGVKRVCYEWRNFLEKEPEEADKIIADMIKRFGIKDQMAVQIANFDLRSMPLQTVAKFKANMVMFVEAFLIEHKEDIILSVRKVEGEAMSTVRQAIVRFNPASIPEAWLDRAKQDLAQFFHSYLKRELGELLEKAIPKLGMYNVIAQKIDLFSAQQLENLIKRICKQELQALEWFGGFIGLMLGFVQIVVNAIAP
ncbi:MAG: DUF445 family protein [Candidatus Obscuribacter sp.]|jgi:uncharacterized membrane protein YheB (UPF0754 family)|nr:DUF445 family protein [Candidatus Obscuribacter sp.]MDQ5967115.1 hypothetical protein [Cyanobacteriota bacterium erpe_2018_sw_39hr_WHONDRS-SW48-000098_B_bin.30]MBK9620436.1 DUF445 family protein [Candidatus Obscuribacter sp.]MBL0187683.1 DUF445 family protein [Candidatus Obscuribacter sp.]MBP6351383.1 DUF445 family protein [Candidatus Obscuribacter sp.]